MGQRRRLQFVRDRARGVSYVVGLCALIFLAALLVAALLTWALT